ncbi:MAG TPA: CHAT domain-containing protein, partial [Fimbriimonas sp.]|nr:CHAT domain-containing protein [Fimbriimonas sp.]
PASYQMPWELLPCPQPLGLIQNVNIVRVMSTSLIPNQAPRSAVTLGLIAADHQSQAYGALQSAEGEIHSIANLFHRSSNVVPKILRPATKSQLKSPPELWHFLGHGDIRPSGGFLQFADGPYYGDEIATALNGSTQFCFLSACNTAGEERAVGCVLASSGVSAVIAMQCPLSDEGGRHFARAFYHSISQGNSVEEAIRDARCSIQGMGLDWFAPVLLRPGWSDPLVIVRREEHNFPSMATRFIGRQEEMKSILNLISKPGQRIVTLTGMGGIGKTTLGCQVGLACLPEMPDGAFLVECEAVRTRSDLVSAIAVALGVRGGADLESDLKRFIQSRRVLLVLDCFERIVHLSEYLVELIQKCSEIKLLVTSRIILGVPGEVEYRVPPMSSKRRKRTVSDAVELFVTTTQQYVPTFGLTSKNRALVLQMVEDLECVPLALLLAASRLRHFSLDELAERIRANRLETLRQKSRGDDKHSDLYRVIGDSLDLLEESDRVLLGILSVFVGGFFLSDAESVIGEFGDVNTIGWLRDNSLLNAHIDGGQMRYRMLDTIREYLQGSPYTKDLSVFERRHSERFARRAVELTSVSGTAKWTSIARAYPIDAANYRQAVQFAIDNNDRALLRIFITTLARVWTELGRTDELELVRPSVASLFAEDVELTKEFLGLDGELAKRSGHYERSQSLWRRRADLSLDSGDFESYADSLLDIADMGLLSNNYSLTKSAMHEFETIDPDKVSTVTQASGFVLQAQLDMQMGDEAAAIIHTEKAVGLLHGRMPDQSQLYVQMRAAQIFRKQGSLGRAQDLTKMTVKQAVETSHFHSAGNALFQLFEIARLSEKDELATLVVFAGSRIPSEVSATLRREFGKISAEMQATHLNSWFGKWIDSYGRSDWTEVALSAANA